MAPPVGYAQQQRTIVLPGLRTGAPGMNGRGPSAPRTAPRRRLDAGEVQLLRLLSTEAPMESIARSLDVSERTLRRRSRALFDKLGVAGRMEAAVWATRHGLL
jgi:DNA-binding NarL/FixJ family response regulator